MGAQMTAPAWVHVARNAGIVGVAVCGVWVALTVSLALTTDWSFIRSVNLSLLALFALSIVAGVGRLFVDRRRRGRVLRDLGPHPMQFIFILNAGLFGVVSIIEGLVGPTGGLFGWGPFAFPLIAAFSAALALGRLQLLENGVWVYWGFTRWDRIAAYEWVSDRALLLHRRGGPSFLKTGVIVVPADHRDAFDAALRTHVTPETG